MERNQDSASKYRESYVRNLRRKVTNETNNIVTHTTGKCDKPKKPNPQTKKEGGIKSALSILKKEIELDAVQSNTYFCKGCGTSHVGLDKSHILSVGQFKRYELLKKNIQLMCRKCHTVWESGTIEQQLALHCFLDNLMFIFTIEPLHCQKFITRLQEYKVWLIESKDHDRLKAINEILEIF